jgi:hypothetical protein
MGLVARNPEQSLKIQSAGEVLGSPPVDANGVVYLESHTAPGEVVHHAQEYREGELVGWTFLDKPGPWALVRPGDPIDPCDPNWAAPEVVESMGVRIGDTTTPLPPIDDFAEELADMPFVPHATARLRFELVGTPAGQVLGDVRYVDGRRPYNRVVANWVETEPGEPAHDAPEIFLRMKFRNYLKMRTGELSHLEAIEDGGNVGESRWTLLLMLHGLAQHPTYRAMYRNLPHLPEELGWWGEAAPFVGSDQRPL